MNHKMLIAGTAFAMVLLFAAAYVDSENLKKTRAEDCPWNFFQEEKERFFLNCVAIAKPSDSAETCWTAANTLYAPKKQCPAPAPGDAPSAPPSHGGTLPATALQAPGGAAAGGAGEWSCYGVERAGR